MECLGPQCAAMLLDWLKARAAGSGGDGSAPAGDSRPQQGLLWTAAPYLDEAPAITTPAELAGALEHLQYAVFRRYKNQLTRAERRGWTTRSTTPCSRSTATCSGSIPRRRRVTRPRSASCARRSARAASGSSGSTTRHAAPT